MATAAHPVATTDTRLRAASGPRGSAHDTAVSEIMSSDVVCVLPDARMSELTRLLLMKGISGVPVVDASACLIGVVSKTDVLKALGTHEDEVRAADIMTPVSLAIPEHATIAQAAALMAYEHVHRLVVTGARGAVTGLVSTLDILRWLAREDGYAVP